MLTQKAFQPCFFMHLAFYLCYTRVYAKQSFKSVFSNENQFIFNGSKGLHRNNSNNDLDVFVILRN